jgi:hypothetical protein
VPALDGLSAAISALILGGTADGFIGVTWLEVIEGGGPRLAAFLALSALILAARPIFGSDVGVLPSMFQVRSTEDRSGVEGM